MKVYPPRDIRPFVMYCVNGKPRSSLLIESTDSMIIMSIIHYSLVNNVNYNYTNNHYAPQFTDYTTS